MIKAEVRGVRELNAKLRRMEARAPGQLEKALEKAAKPIEDYAVGAAPVETGALARSITTRPMGAAEDHARVRIGPAWAVYDNKSVVEYGRFQEFGTSKMAAQPFMRPAFDAGRDEALRIFTEEMKRVAS